MRTGREDLTVISNKRGVDGFGLGKLLTPARSGKDDLQLRGREQGIRAPVPVGRAGLEFTPQGTLAEKLRAGGAGIQRLLHLSTGVGTIVADGKGNPRVRWPHYVMERSLVPEVRW